MRLPIEYPSSLPSITRGQGGVNYGHDAWDPEQGAGAGTETGAGAVTGPVPRGRIPGTAREKCTFPAGGYDGTERTKPCAYIPRWPEMPSLRCLAPSPYIGSATFRLSLAIALALAALLVARPAAQAAEPDAWFARDKALHASVSFALAGIGYADTTAFTKLTGIRVLSGAGIALSAGIAKEVYDQDRGRGFSWRDLTWDAIGTATGTLVAWLVDRYLL